MLGPRVKLQHSTTQAPEILTVFLSIAIVFPKVEHLRVRAEH